MSQLTVDEAFALAVQHHRSGRLAEAEAIYRQILSVQPHHSDSLHLLGMTAFQSGRPEIALPLVEQAILLNPNAAIYRNNYGQVLERLGKAEEAAAEYRTAIALDPNYAEPHNNLGNYHERKEAFTAAIECYLAAIRINPRYAEARTNLGNVFKEQGDIDSAITLYREAIALKHNMSVLDSNLLLALHYQKTSTRASLAEEHRQWNLRHALPLYPTPPIHPNRRDPERRLRIGYVSADFREHPVARFMQPILENHDRSHFELYAYSSVTKTDRVTTRLQRYSDTWRDASRLSDTELTEVVRKDEIDILVDLSAHTAGSRLLVFARKPAPVQVTYLAYCSTTGLDAIDYRLTDRYLDPLGVALDLYSEATEFLPDCYWCYSAPELEIEPGPPPSERTGQVTFGCLNNFCKVSPEVLRCWARILTATKDSTLLLYVRPGEHRARVSRILEECGVNPNRAQFVGRQSFAEYFATYNRIDIALDPFPFTGGTTSCDALWMGVPVITMTGETAVSRGGSSLLHNLRLDNLVTENEADYVQVASALASDSGERARLRTNLRRMMIQSPLMDAARFTRNLEAAYRRMWVAWCRRETP